MNDVTAELWQVGTLAAGVLLTVLVLGIGHWFPWIHRLSRIQTYIYGVSTILAGFTTWRLLNRDWQTPVGLLTIAVAGGAAVVGAYWIDDLVLRVRQAEKATRGDNELSIEE